MSLNSLLQNKTVLLVDDDDDSLQVIGARCRSVGMEVFTARNLLTALGQVEKHRPDVVCVDVNMPTGNGIGFCEMLASDPATAAIPRILITGDVTAERKEDARRLNAPLVPKSLDVWGTLLPHLERAVSVGPVKEKQPAKDATLAKTKAPGSERSSTEVPAESILKFDRVSPGDPETEVANAHEVEVRQEELLDSVFALLGSELEEDESSDEFTEEAGPPWILCIDDDADFTDALRCRLEAHGVAVVRAFDGMEGYRTAFSKPAKAIILDYEMPNGHGDYVLRRLKENPVTAEIPVVMLTGNKDKSIKRKLMALGA
ncbi:MAG: response regulator, partial [Lacipirellulaceae bacterium]